jgi:cell division protein FtsL
MIKPKIRISTLLLVALAVASGIVLFRVSERVQSAEDKLARMERAADKEAENIRVLRAEWDYLNRPDRLEGLAHQYLKMEQPAVDRVWSGGGDLPPAPQTDMQAQDVALSPEHKPGRDAAPVPVPRLKPRHDTDDFRKLLNNLTPAQEGRR